MAIERYQGGATPFQQVSPTGYMAQAQTMSNLSQKLDEWSARKFEQDKLEVIEKGQQQAIADMTSGNPARLEKGYSFYADAYNTVAKAAYNIEVESDLKKKAMEIEAENPLDHEQFNARFDGFTKGAMSKIEDPNFKAIYWKQAKQIGATTYNGMAKKSYENALKNQEDVINAGFNDAKISYESSFANGNVEEMTHHLATIHALLENKAKMGLIDSRIIPFEMKKLQKGAQTNKAMLDLDNSIEAGQTDFINNYMKSDDYKSLSFDERTALTKRMHEHADIKYKAKADEASGGDKLLEASSKRKSIEIMKQVYGGKDVSDQTLRDMVADGSLSKPDYDKIAQDIADLKGGASVDDSQAVTYYELRVESISPTTIAQDGRLTAKTKQRLISKVISHKETVRGHDALAQGFKQQKATLGATSWQMSTQYLNANIFDDDPDKEKTKRLNILNQVRDEVEGGKVNPLEAHVRTQELADAYVEKNKVSMESMKYDRAVKKYNDEVTQYRLNSNSTFGKLKKSLGQELPAPVAPAKPSNYIPKAQRN